MDLEQSGRRDYHHKWGKIIAIFFLCLTIFGVTIGLIVGFVIIPRTSCRSDCLNGGVCSGPKTCSCPSGWTGSICQTYTCSSTCQNGGTCSGPNTCSCPSGWTGSICQTHTCSSTCLNGGSCSGPNMCNCIVGWMGSLCNQHFCSPRCQNGGECTGPNNCRCLDGWQGATCEAFYCRLSCQNGGTCTGANHCTCKSGYSGSQCEKKGGGGSGGGRGCYYGCDNVLLVDGRKRLIRDLKIGDRVWSIDPYHPNKLIEDEIVLMMHNEPNTTAIFHTITTIDGDQISLTDTHFIPVFNTDENRVKIIRSSEVTTRDQLVTLGRSVPIRYIEIHTRQGFYSPLTLTSYLMVNKISTNVFSDNHQVSPHTLHLVFNPIRLYYRLARYFLGENYQPFQEITEGFHPLARSYKKFDAAFRELLESSRFILTPFCAVSIFFIRRYLSYPSINK